MKILKATLLALVLALGTIACSQEEDIIKPDVEFEQESTTVSDKDDHEGDDLENI
ncbi:MAG: hypothetical protein OCD76_14850 [Reichenbachiella sp.]